MRHSEIVLNNSIHCSEHDKIKELDLSFECFSFDTESCTRYENDNTGAKVYLWGLMATRSNVLIYGETLQEFIETMGFIFENNYKNKFGDMKIKKVKGEEPEEKYIKITVAVHNIAWDIEFFKYALADMGYNYRMGTLDVVRGKGRFYNTIKDVEQEKTYHIVQADNVVYGANIYTPYSFKIDDTDVKLCIDFFDSLKIIVSDLASFPDYIDNIDEVFYKMKEEYDYKSYRPDGHKPTLLELRYLYNDVYLLKRGLEDFYIDGLCRGTMPIVGKRTASSIAFDELKRITFGEEKTEECFIDYFQLNKTTTFENTRKVLEVQSYGGGFTHANHKFINKVLNVFGCSLDINSSYPSQMAYKNFPYGKPFKKTYGDKPTFKEDSLFIVEVGFDYVKPKKPEFDLPIFKIGAGNSKTLKPLYGDISAQEYFSTNISGNEVLEVYKNFEGCNLSTNYNVVLTSVELEFWLKHYDFGYFEKQENPYFTREVEKFKGLIYGNCIYYKCEVGKFRKFVEEKTEMKVKNKKLGIKSLVNQAKLFLNSAYGKFGTRQDKREKDMIINNGIYAFTSDNQIEYIGKEFYRPYASFVTAYGRLQLWNSIIYAVGVENFIYCDTDSIYCIREEKSLIDDMNNIGQYIDKTKLGCWDIETHFNCFKVLGQKKYMYYNIDKDKEGKEKGINVKCAGLPKDARKIIANEGFDAFYLGKKVEGKKQKKKVVGGCLLLDTEFTIKKIAW